MMQLFLRRTIRVSIAALFAVGCASPSKVEVPSEGSERAEEESEGDLEENQEAEMEGLRFEVRASDAFESEGDSPTRSVSGEPLGAEATAELLGRLKEIEPADKDRAAFSFRSRSKPPPKAGRTVETAFPPGDEVDGTDGAGREEPAAEGRLEVVRHAPRGSVEMAPRLSVTFSRPMVPLGDADEVGVPVRLQPDVEGTWRWIGTKTVLFEPAGDRFPMATNYRAVVPESTSGLAGEAMEEGLDWEFSTPPVQVERVHPKGGPVGREPLFFMAFNQRVDPEAILEHVEVWGGGRMYEAALAADQRIERDEEVAKLVEETPEGHWVAFYLPKQLRAGTGYKLGLTEGAPSAEGDRRTKEGQYESFRTFDPLAVERGGCGREPCWPGAAWSFEFNNPLDEESVDASSVRVEPSLPDKKVEVHRNRLIVRGESSPETTYEVELAGSIRDAFDQTLGEPHRREFEVAPAPPTVYGAGGARATLDPEGPREYRIHSSGYETLSVVARRVEPGDWPDFVRAMRRDSVEFPGKQIFEKTIEVEASEGAFQTTGVDLTQALNEGRGDVVLLVEGGEAEMPPEFDPPRRRTSFEVWVQSTEIAVDAYVDDRELVAWTTSLASGETLEDVEISLGSSTETVATDSRGVARLALPDEIEEPWSGVGNVVTAKKGGDTAFVSETEAWSRGRSRWLRRDATTGARWFVWDDRNLYRPGETVRMKGWVRRIEDGTLSLPEEGAELRYRVEGPRRNEIASGAVSVDAHGGFDLEVELPDDINLGTASAQFELASGEKTEATRHSFRIQEFRTPTFEVGVTAPAGPNVVGESIQSRLEATYYGGGEVRGAQTNWMVESTPTQYEPPGWDEFAFGAWRPWWIPTPGGKSRTRTHTGETNASGEDGISIDLKGVDPPRPQALQISGSVTDVNRQTYGGEETALVHPASAYVGLKMERRFVSSGEPLDVEVVATEIDGDPVEGREIRVEAERLDWTYRDGEWREVTEETLRCVVASESQPVDCTFEPEKGGVWRVTARVRDSEGRVNETRVRVWVGGGERPASRRLEREELRLIPQRRRWKPGESAELLVQVPFADANAMVTYEREGEIQTKRFSVEGTSHELSIPVEPADIPQLEVRVDAVGATHRLGPEGEPREDKPKRPAFATGTIEFEVSNRSKRLDVDVESEAPEYRPGGSVDLSFSVARSGGEPAGGSQLAVAVVDEAVLAAAGYELGSPLEAFFPPTSGRLDVRQLRSTVQLATLEALPGTESAMNRQTTARQPMAPGAEMAADAARMRGGGAAGKSGIELRSDFRPLAFFEPAIETDEQGRADVTFELPDNVTRYRVMAVAVDGAERYGTGESTFASRLPLRVQPSMPRFLNSGDRAQLPLVIHNQSGEERSVRLAGRATNLALEESRGVRFDVPAGDRVEYRFPSRTEEAGTARLQFAAASAGWSDAAEVAIPVRTPATTEAFATYGSMEKGSVEQLVRVPDDAVEEYGELEISTASTALHELTDAFLYLVDYPYDCSEQIASRLLAVSALRDVLAAFDAKGLPPSDELVASMEGDIESLAGLQTHRGGFALWSRENGARPFVSVHATHALAVARDRGFEVPEEVLEGARRYLDNIEDHIPDRWPAKVRRTVWAYGLYVLQKMGAPKPGETASLAERSVGDELSVEAAAWLMSALASMSSKSAEADELRRQIDNRIVEEAGSAQVTTHYEEGGHLAMHSNRRADALVLEAMIRSSTGSDLLPKIVEGLMGHRTRGRWSNTQENVFVLLALREYFDAFEAEEPDFAADIWLGEGYAARHEYRSRTTKKQRVSIPLAEVLGEAEHRSAPLLVDKQGDRGRLYYRLGMEYAPESRELEAVERGFAVERTYEAVDADGDVRRRSDGTWEIRAGARVRVRLSMVVPARRHHVALVDPFAAGFEPLNSAIATTEPIPDDPEDEGRQGRRWWWYRPWFEHQNLRDERAEAFSSSVPAGVHSYSYVVRATTPGEFIVPPPKAEEMYHPETFGRGSTDRVEVVAED